MGPVVTPRMYKHSDTSNVVKELLLEFNNGSILAAIKDIEGHVYIIEGEKPSGTIANKQ